jgi:hypothetical protein
LLLLYLPYYLVVTICVYSIDPLSTLLIEMEFRSSLKENAVIIVSLV